jgi:hypothetical protein
LQRVIRDDARARNEFLAFTTGHRVDREQTFVIVGSGLVSTHSRATHSLISMITRASCSRRLLPEANQCRRLARVSGEVGPDLRRSRPAARASGLDLKFADSL